MGQCLDPSRVMTDVNGPPPKKRRKSSAPLSDGIKLLQGTERSSLTAGADDGGLPCVTGTSDKELWLIQLPRDLDPTLIHGHTIRLNETQKIDVQDAQHERSFVVKPSRVEKLNVACTLLLPTSKPGRLKTGPSVEGQLCLQQSVDVPPADIPAPPVDRSKVMEIPGELKQRWKPFGSMDTSIARAELHSPDQHQTHKHKKSKKKTHHQRRDSD